MWADSHVVVTGAATGIGRALAAAFAARGARVSGADVDAAAMAATAAEIGCAGLTCDVAQRSDVDAMIAAATATHGPIDLICSNAGIGRSKSVADSNDALFDLLFNVNLRSAVHVTQSYLATLTANGSTGRILFTASENSLSIPPAVEEMRLGLYAATKHALLVMVEWLRLELKDGPLSPALLFPGPVLNERFRAMMASPRYGEGLDPARKAMFEAQLISPAECADRAIAGLERGLFYIPTHAHLQADAHARMSELDAAFAAMADLI